MLKRYKRTNESVYYRLNFNKGIIIPSCGSSLTVAPSYIFPRITSIPAITS